MTTLPKYVLATDPDFDLFRKSCFDDAGWDEVYKSETTRITKKKSNDAILPVRVQVAFPDLDPETLYDILHDHQYRKEWDTHMIEGIVITQLDAHNEVGYYSAKMPTPVSNRDFVNQRSWRAKKEEGEWIIMNHSVEHPDYPPDRKGCVRANSILTGYLILRREKGGCDFIYYTQSNPNGWIPNWVINSTMTTLAPKLVDKLHAAAVGYKEWKDKHDPTHKPWLQ